MPRLPPAAPLWNSGNSRDANYGGTYTLGGSGHGTGYPAAAKTPLFTSGYVTLPTIPASTALFRSFSVEAWVYFGTKLPTANTRIFDMGKGAASDNLIMYFGATTLYVQVYRAGASVMTFNTSDISFVKYAYFHLVLTCAYDGISSYTYNVYINNGLSGSYSSQGLVGTATSTLNLNDVERASNFIGKSNTATDPVFTGGTIAEFVSRAPQRAL